MNGDFAFHKYALLQWLPHLFSLQDNQISQTRIIKDFGEDIQAICKNLACFHHPPLSSESKTLLTEETSFEVMTERLKSLYTNIEQQTGKYFSDIHCVERLPQKM
jgi:hypothetical protein